MVRSYSQVQIYLHWGVVLLVGCQFLFAESMGHAFHESMKAGERVTNSGAPLHVMLGLLIGILAIWRVVLHFTKGVPPLPDREAAWMKAIAHVVHWGLYILLILMPISGAVAWFGMIGPAALVHEILKALLIVLVVLHIAAALYHQFVLKTNLMARMRPSR